ncbi:MAG: SpoIIE family protein phosphatase [Clostridia bacterium]|nr:SpoIIE family protein phosphatase [Clostridia bacterium]
MPKTAYDTEEIMEEYYAEDVSRERNPARYLRMIGIAFAGLCFSQLNALGNLSPFAVSFLSVLPFEFCFPCFVGSAVGYFLALPWQAALKYTLALSVTALFRLFIHKKFPSIDGSAANYVAAFCSLLSAGLTVMLFTGFSFQNVVMLILESALGFCSSIFFLRAFNTPVMSVGIGSLHAKDSVSLVLSLCIFLLCMSGFTIEGISPARIFSCLAVMFASLYKGSAAGSVTGVCVGAALCINPEFRHLFPAYAIGGLAAGVFSPFGQVGVAAAFGVCYGAVCIISGVDEGFIVSLIEVGIAFAAFLIIPVKYISSLQDFLQKSGMISDNPVNRQVAAHLRKAANNIYEVSKIVSTVSDKLDNVINPELNRLFANVQQRVCDGCENKGLCWNKGFDSTATDILRLTGIEKRSKGRSPLEKRCMRSQQLIAFTGMSKKEYVDSMATKMKIREMRRVLTDQFCGIGDFLCEVSDQVSESRIIDTARSTAIRTALQDSGVDIDALSYFTSGVGAVSVEITILDKIYEFDRKKVKTILELMTKRFFDSPDITVTSAGTTVTYIERLPFSVQTGFFQKPLKENSVCGDTVAMTESEKYTFCALLSDGMGTGKRAAVDSVMTAALMEKLLSAGFSFDSALKIVNSALIAKSTDESIATIDGVEINMFTGKADFYKAGATISLVRKGSQVITVEKSSLPLGILRNVGFAKESVTMEVGDIILVVSDGVTANDCGWISDELLSWSTNSMGDLARHIVSLADLRNEKRTADDLTVLAVKLMNNKK